MKNTMKEEEKRLLEIILDCWFQFAYPKDKSGYYAGGLSTLEMIEWELKNRKIINRNGNLTKEAKKIFKW